MSCFHPTRAYLLASGGVSFKSHAKDQVGDIKLPCGQCIGCRLDRARDWSLRIGHESKLHEQSHFLTLTYTDELMPVSGSLNYRDFQLFMKRTRKALGETRFFMCGEYGETTYRPHYHAILFGLKIPDLVRYATGTDGSPTFTSERINALWGKGFVVIGSVTPQSAGYVARYALKKVTGKQAETHYQRVTVDGEIIHLQPEFCHMSTRPGIGAAWYQKYHSDVHTHDYVIRDGSRNRVPRYYDKLSANHAVELDVLKMDRQTRARARASDNTPERLAVREEVQRARIRTLKRAL